MKKIDWLKRFVILLTGVFLTSFLPILSDYWLPVTVQLVIWVLIFTCIIEMFFPYHKWFRWFVELVVISLVMLLYLDWKNIVPFISFVLGTWFIYLLMIRWFASKWRALVVILVSAIGLSIIDTFTYHDLWSEIMILIGAGLLLLVVHHLKVLSEKSPEGFEHLSDYPGTVIAPIAIFFCVLLPFSIVAPDVGPLLTDPYTAWKKFTGGEPAISSYADQVHVGDRADTDRGEIISGYSRDDRQLGGAFDYDYSPVMSVETSDPTYYRGEVRYVYNGSGWEHEDESYHLNSYVVLSDKEEQSLFVMNESPIDISLLETRAVTQTISVSTHSAYKSHVLFGSYKIEKVEIVESVERDGALDHIPYGTHVEGEDSLLWLPSVAELHYLNNAGMFPEQYQVTSQVPLIDEDGLRAARSIVVEDNYWDKYLQLPSELPARVSELAKEIVAEQTNPYDQVKAIELYLKETYAYTTEPDLGLGESDDFVERFLFEIQEGYCDYFSTAMVVLTRTLDIPARWVKGYTHGTKRIDETHQSYYLAEQDPLGPGTYDVRNANAHSWVEVYFPGYGWIPFEPTATFFAPTYKVSTETDVVLDEVMDDPTRANDKTSLSIGKMVLPVLIGIFVIAFFGILLFLIWKQKLSFTWHRWKHRGVKSTNLKIVLEVEHLLNHGQRLGYKHFTHETLHETTTRWVNQNKWLEKELRELVLLFEKAKYGKAQMTDEELKLTQDKVHCLKKRMKTGA